MISASKLANKASRFATENSPAILTGIGVVGAVTTAVLSGRAAIKADRYLEKETTLRGFDFTFREKAQLSWKFFVPPALSLVGTVTCIICANRVGTRRTAAMAAAYGLAQESFAEYKTKVIEKIGENKERQVRDEVAKEQVTKNPPPGDMIVVGGDVIFHEAFTGRYFKSTMEDVKAAVNRVNHYMLNDFSADLNDFYDFVGLARTDMGDRLGWNTDKLVELQFSTIMTDDSRPAISFTYKNPPHEGYFRHAR